jgi:hypothetical protein
MTEQSTMPEAWRVEIDRTRDERLHRLATVTRQKGRDYDAKAFLGMRKLFGEEVITVDSWRAYGGIAARSTLDEFDPRGGWYPMAVRRAEMDAQRIIELTESIERHRRAIDDHERTGNMCYGECACRTTWPRRIVEYEAELARLQGTTAPVVTPDAIPEPEEGPDRTCECNDCTDVTCQGGCDSCDDHDCQQCFGDHSAYSCCGYCPECDSHAGDGDDEKCSMGHCHSCEHECRDY